MKARSSSDKYAAVEIDDITVYYGCLPALYRVTATIPRQKITAVIGPNGSGKSTLLKAILGLLPLKNGMIHILGLPFDQARDRVAYVPQQDEVDWNYPLLVREVVAMGRYRTGKFMRRLAPTDRSIIEAALDKLSMRHLEYRPISRLSGGEKQRMFLARALVREAELFFLDEPFNGVDAATERVIMDYLEELKGNGKTVVMVHHRLEDVTNFDWTLLLNRELIECGPVDQVLNRGKICKAYGISDLPLLHAHT